jgi:peptide/nickel transport system ATP-binding protein
MNEPLLNVEHLSVRYPGRGRRSPFQAVSDVSFSIAAGETLGLVGESGSGKSTIGRAILGLVNTSGGVIRFDGEDITHAPRSRRRILARDLQVIFQDPNSSLNPVRTIGASLSEPLVAQGEASRSEIRQRTSIMLRRVGLPEDARDRYPGQFSGGQRQRIAIARALILEPRLIVCDEPVSALDLSIQAQVINLLDSFQRELGVSYLFIAHDLAVVRHLSNRIVVLRAGRVEEHGMAREIYERPQAEYTRALLRAAPVSDPRIQRRRSLSDSRSIASPSGH